MTRSRVSIFVLLLISIWQTESRCMTQKNFYGSKGLIKSHEEYGISDYDVELSCEYKIFAPVGNFVKISVKELNLENNDMCLFDYFLLSDRQLGSRGHRICNNRSPRSILLYDNEVTIQFVSDNSGVGRGGVLEFQVISTDSRVLTTGSCGLSPYDGVQSRRWQGDNLGDVGFDLDSVHRQRRPMASGVIRGNEAVNGRWPWMVSVQLGSAHKCGGSVVAPGWVLTAAHCFDNQPNPSLWNVVMGEFSRFTDDPRENKVSVARIVVHPDYNSRRRFDHDLALLQVVPTSTSFSSRFRKQSSSTSQSRMSICLPQQPVDMTTCYSGGWGLTATDASLANVLQDLQMPLVSMTLCNSSLAFNGKIVSGMLCAGYVEGGRGTCNGDSGGPLMCASKSGVWTIYGTVSFSKSCAVKNKPTVFADIYYHRNWIQEVVES